MVQITDVGLVVGFAGVLIIVYFIGSYWKHRTLTKYAHWFEEIFSSRANVQFASFGHAGLKVKCEMKDKSDGFRELHFAISLGPRENLMHYPLVSVMGTHDRVTCWGIVEKPVQSNVMIMNATDRKEAQIAENQANMRKLELSDLGAAGYAIFASNREYTTKFLSRASMSSKLKRLRDIELVELDSLSSLVRMVSRLKPEKLRDLTDFFLSIGRAI